MTYRDDAASLENRHQLLQQALQENRERSSALGEEEAALHHQLAELHTKLETARRPKRQLPLANVLIASPCDVPWTSMVGDDRVRHCGDCKKDVHNLSAMTRDEINAFLERAGAEAGTNEMPCISLFRRTDGTILTADCPVGVRRRRMRSLLAATLGLGAMSMVAFSGLALFTLMQGTLSALTAPTEPNLPVTVAEVAPPAKTAFGYVVFEVPDGSLVWEGSVLRGTAPLSMSTEVGTHVYRVTDKHQRTSEVLSAIVRENEIWRVSFTQAVPPQRMAGGIGRMPRVTR